jgi:hypothetical protein
LRSDELEKRARISAFIGDANAYVDYTADQVFNELNDRLRSVFSDQVVSARAGYWMRRDTITTSTLLGGFGAVRFPQRAVVGGLEAVDFLINGQFVHLQEMSAREANDWVGGPTLPTGGIPAGYWCNAELINIVPTPTAAVTVRLTYYLRPSLLVLSQSSVSGGAFQDRGRITGVDSTNRVVTVNAIPFDYSPSAGVAIVTGAVVDVVRPHGWHVATAVDQTCSISGTAITIAGLSSAQFVDSVQQGDYIRARDQTDWPALPSDFHRMLADTAAVNILRELSMDEKASTLSAAASADFMRFAKLISPRVKTEPKQIRLRPYWMRGRW